MTIKDIKHHIENKDIFNSLEVINRKINQLHYEKSKAKTKEEQKNIMKFIGKLYDLRNIALVKLYDLELISLVGTINIESECVRHKTIYVDTLTGQKLDTKRLVLFPNMKYCRKPRKNRPFDLDNLQFLGDYKEENSKKIINKNYILSVKDKEYTIPESFMVRAKGKINLDELPIRPYEPKPKKLVNNPVDEIEYKKASYILHKFLEKQLSDRTKERKQKAKIKIENKKKIEQLIKAKAKSKAQSEEKKKANVEQVSKKSKPQKRNSSLREFNNNPNRNSNRGISKSNNNYKSNNSKDGNY